MSNLRATSARERSLSSRALESILDTEDSVLGRSERKNFQRGCNRAALIERRFSRLEGIWFTSGRWRETRETNWKRRGALILNFYLTPIVPRGNAVYPRGTAILRGFTSHHVIFVCVEKWISSLPVSPPRTSCICNAIAAFSFYFFIFFFSLQWKAVCSNESSDTTFEQRHFNAWINFCYIVHCICVHFINNKLIFFVFYYSFPGIL